MERYAWVIEMMERCWGIRWGWKNTKKAHSEVQGTLGPINPMGRIKSRPYFFKGLAATPYSILGKSCLCTSLEEDLICLVVTLNLEHPCGRPDQFIGKDCPQPTIGLPWRCPQHLACWVAAESMSSQDIAQSNSMCLGQHSLEEGSWAQQACRHPVCMYLWSQIQVTALLNYHCHSFSSPSVFCFVSFYFGLGKVLFTILRFVEADQKVSAHHSDSLRQTLGTFWENVLYVPECLVWWEGFSKLPSALFLTPMSPDGAGMEKVRSPPGKLPGLSLGMCLMHVCTPCMGPFALPNLTDLLFQTILDS